MSGPPLRVPRKPAEPVDDTVYSFVNPRRARQVRLQIEAEQRLEAEMTSKVPLPAAPLADDVTAPVAVTGCSLAGCPGRYGTCYLPASRCGLSAEERAVRNNRRNQ